ncbi:DUF5723 family protein [Aurantibacillus circumpalustris]|uniref:DUF5723 family protein n=1 Tax=Aurantibacillus circumpalustris TaxID=3036359 RepID=UPI00295BEFBC|nr:DUF5723 family protein [Aurantibacillus circumpalustris]
MKEPIKYNILIGLILTVGIASAQYNANFLNYSKTGRSVSVNLDFEAGSNGMSSKLVDKLIWGGYIDNDLKAESAKHLNNKNNFGLLLNYDVNAFVKGGNKFDFLIGFKNQEVLNATYTRDFFNLMFYGNQMYKGKTADLGDCSLNALRFQEIKFGAMMHHVDSVGKIGISVSFINGEQLFYIKTNKKSSFYTSADGSELVFNSNFNMALSDTSNKGLGSFNGVGASADIFFETTYKTRAGRKCLLTVNANNLGFIHWRNNSVQYSSDSSLHYTGYNITSINDLRDSTISRINSDSLLIKLANARHENFNVNTPTNLVIINKVHFGNVFCLGTGFRYIFNANYRPYIFVEPEFNYKNMIFCLHAGYGGYVKINLGASITWNSKAWFVRIGSNSLQGYFLPKTAYGQGVFISLAKKLK